ncbi:Signal recognition particle protein [archaeon HR01]|nr:Signal recognition particle protein [archaeon HR01]
MVASQLAKTFKDVLSRFLASPSADRQAVEELVRGIQRALLVSDVNVELVSRLSDRIRERSLSEKLPPGVSRKDAVLKIVYEELASLLGSRPPKFSTGGKKPYIIMLLGIQGAGKTTTAAKLANYLKKNGFKVGVVCADTYRPGAFQQLQQLLAPRDIPVYGEPDSKDSVAIAVKGIRELAAHDLDVVIIDTAGRHKEQSTLMEEMKMLEKAIKPDENLLVIDGTIGQQAGVHAKSFHENTRVGSIIVTKLDTSAKGGGALSAVSATGAQIKFIGVGEALEDFEAFNPSGYIASLLGVPDIESLVERVKLAELEVSEEKAKALLSGRFTLEDMVNQLREMKKLGPLRKILSKLPLPGMADLPEEELEKAEERIKKWSAIIQSMTAEEKSNPQIVDDSRARRIARGAGVSERDVKELIRNYQLSRKMMKDRRLRHVLRQTKGI